MTTTLRSIQWIRHIPPQKKRRRPIACRPPDKQTSLWDNSLFPLLLSHIRERFLARNHAFASADRHHVGWRFLESIPRRAEARSCSNAVKGRERPPLTRPCRRR